MTRFAKVLLFLIVLSSLALALKARLTDVSKCALKTDDAVLNILENNGKSTVKSSFEKKTYTTKSGRSFIEIERQFETGYDVDENHLFTEIKKYVKKSRLKLKEYTVEKSSAYKMISFSIALGRHVIYKGRVNTRPGDSQAAYKPVNTSHDKPIAKIGIVLDDFGYNVNNINSLFEIDAPITLSVLPNLAYSKEVCSRGRERGHELILHLPLEPHEELSLEKDTLMADMQPAVVKRLLAKHLESTPYIKGVSNHMGSKATEDYDFILALFGELKKKGLYFLDNLVTGKSVCKETAKKVDLKLASRSVFLDNNSNKDYIRKQLTQTAEIARKNGWAIGVGHDRVNTIEVLSEVVPQLQEKGYRFVYISELIM